MAKEIVGGARLPSDKWFARQRYAVVDAGYESSCWLWQQSLTDGGYGRCGYGRRGHVTYALAHRVFWEREHGPVPAGLDLDHLCRNRACVNPAHLEPTTRLENLRRGKRSRRLTAEQVDEIRASSAMGIVLAARYGVSATTISDVRNRKTWREAWA